jgi:hypothetical protein
MRDALVGRYLKVLVCLVKGQRYGTAGRSVRRWAGIMVRSSCRGPAGDGIVTEARGIAPEQAASVIGSSPLVVFVRAVQLALVVY